MRDIYYITQNDIPSFDLIFTVHTQRIRFYYYVFADQHIIDYIYIFTLALYAH